MQVFSIYSPSFKKSITNNAETLFGLVHANVQLAEQEDDDIHRYRLFINYAVFALFSQKLINQSG